MAQAHWLDNKGWRHTVRIRNTYCFLTATIVTWTPIDVALYAHCLPSFVLTRWL
jgi:hypothetical protein